MCCGTHSSKGKRGVFEVGYYVLGAMRTLLVGEGRVQRVILGCVTCCGSDVFFLGIGRGCQCTFERLGLKRGLRLIPAIWTSKIISIHKSPDCRFRVGRVFHMPFICCSDKIFLAG